MPRDHRLIRLRPHSHHAIETLTEQVNAAVGAADFQLKQRVTRREFRQARHHHAPGQNVRHIDPNAPQQSGFVLTKQAFDFIHVRQQILAALVQHQTVLGRLDLARGALQQARTEQGFQRLHMLGHRRSGQAQAFPGEGETRHFADADEGAQQFQLVHGPDLYCSAQPTSDSGFRIFITL
ncbi:hypothetical protein D3C87_1241970 [compost metagenome]